MKTLILALLAIFSVTAVVPAQRSEKLSVRVEQQKTATASRFSVKFVSVVEDSRCPQDVDCMWAGVATIKIRLRKNGKPAREFELNTNQPDKTITFEGHEIRLASLTPYPRSGGDPIKPGAYSAALIITSLQK